MCLCTNTFPNMVKCVILHNTKNEAHMKPHHNSVTDKYTAKIKKVGWVGGNFSTHLVLPVVCSCGIEKVRKSRYSWPHLPNEHITIVILRGTTNNALP